MTGLKYFDAQTIREALTSETAITTVRAAMIALSNGSAKQLLRSFIGLENRTFAIMPAALSARGYFGAKLVSVFFAADGRRASGMRAVGREQGAHASRAAERGASRGFPANARLIRRRTSTRRQKATGQNPRCMTGAERELPARAGTERELPVHSRTARQPFSSTCPDTRCRAR